jgi:hypothetical protein
MTVTGSRWRGLAPLAISVAIYTLIAVLGWWSAWTSDPSRFAVPGGGDPGVSMWFLTWAPYTLLHPHNPLFSNFGNYPFGVNMVANTATLPLGYLLAPVTLLAGPVVSFNVLGTLSPILAACAGLAFVRRFTSWYPAAFGAGLLYGFSPYVVAQASGHLNLEFVALLPLILLVLHDLIVRQQGRPVPQGLLLGVLVVVQFFISSELLLDTGILAVAGVILIGVLDRGAIRSHMRYAVRGLSATAIVVVGALAYPVWFLFAGPGHVIGPIQASPQEYRADLLAPILPDSFQHFAPSVFTRISNRFSVHTIENGSYLGLPLVAFLIVTVCVLRRTRVVLVAGLLGLCAFVLSLGSYLEVGNHDYTNIVLPETVIAKLPLLSNLIPARFSLFVTLFSAVVLAVALERLHETRLWGESRLASVVAPLIIGTGLLGPLLPAWPFAVQATTLPYFTSAAAQAIPLDSVVLVYPFPDEFYSNPQVWQASSFLRFKMPGGRFIVPEPGTRAAGTSRSSLTDSVLRKVALGDPPKQSPVLRAEVDKELRAWHVRTIVAAPAGANPAVAFDYLRWLLRQAPQESDGMMVWYNWHASH